MLCKSRVDVHVIEARNLAASSYGAISSPLCVVECQNQHLSSRTHKNQLNCIFDEVLALEVKDIERETFNSEFVTITIYHSNRIFKNEVIGKSRLQQIYWEHQTDFSFKGIVSFELAEIYEREHHELFREWIALTDCTGATNSVKVLHAVQRQSRFTIPQS